MIDQVTVDLSMTVENRFMCEWIKGDWSQSRIQVIGIRLFVTFFIAAEPETIDIVTTHQDNERK